jgi:hypothetical protein
MEREENLMYMITYGLIQELPMTTAQIILYGIVGVAASEY